MRPPAGAAPCEPGALGPCPCLCLDSETCPHPVLWTCPDASLRPGPSSSPAASLCLSLHEDPPCSCNCPSQPPCLCTWCLGPGPCASAPWALGGPFPTPYAASFLCASCFPWDFLTVQPTARERNSFWMRQPHSLMDSPAFTPARSAWTKSPNPQQVESHLAFL